MNKIIELLCQDFYMVSDFHAVVRLRHGGPL